MPNIFLLLGEHFNRNDFNRLKIKLEKILEKIPKDRILFLVEVGIDPLGLDKGIVSSDENLKEYFDLQKENVTKRIKNFLKKGVKSLDLELLEFSELLIKWLSENELEVILEDLNFEDFKKYTRSYHNSFTKINAEISDLAMGLPPGTDPDYLKNDLNNKIQRFLQNFLELKDNSFVKQINNLENENKVVIIIRGSEHHALYQKLKDEGFDVLKIDY